MQPDMFTLSWLAAQLKRDRRVLGRDLEGLTADEEIERGERTERRWYLHRVVAHLVGRAADEDDDQRQRLAAAQAVRYEIENDVRSGKLIDVTEAQEVWGAHIGAARAKFLSLPTSLAPQLRNVTDTNVIASLIRTKVYEALNELSEWQPGPPDGPRATTGNGSHVAQPADADGEPVGRRIPPT